MEYISTVEEEDLKSFRKIYEKKNSLINLLKISSTYEISLKVEIKDELDSVCQLEAAWWNRVLGTDRIEACKYYVDLSTGEIIKEEEDVR